MTTLNNIYNAFINGAAICTDTRNIKSGCIFFALKGENFNGNIFAAEAIRAGAILAVIDEKSEEENSQIILVKDVLEFLQQLAKYHRQQFNIPLIGITGSNGKTTTKELVNRVLSEKYNTLCTKGNLNNHIGVPLTLLSLSNDHEIAIIEMGANHQKEIELLCSLALPTHVLVTNVGKAHLEGFGGFEGVKKGKGEMYEFAKENNAHIFLNSDSTNLKEMVGDYNNVTRYGKNQDAKIKASETNINTHVSVQWTKNDNDQIATINSNITGNYNFENILSAIAIGNYFGVPDHAIKNAIESYIPDNQRSQEINTGSMHIVLDAYNANPTSMEAALRNFDANFKGNRAVFLGEMLELGETSAQEHSSILELLKTFKFDVIVLVGKNFKNLIRIPGIHFFENSAEAGDWVLKNNLDHFNILIKGSRGSKMEKVLEGLRNKIPETGK